MAKNVLFPLKVQSSPFQVVSQITIIISAVAVGGFPAQSSFMVIIYFYGSLDWGPQFAS